MFIEILIAIACGVASGIFTGLVPGLHVNLVVAVVVSSVGGVFAGIPVGFLVVGIISLALTHSFLDSIPSIYLGAPDESQVVAVLPGHQFLREGLGHHAILYTLVGSFAALLLTLLIFPLGLLYLEPVYLLIKPFIGKFLVVVVLILCILSRNFFLNLFFFIIAGLLGMLCFSLASQQHILLPLLSGLFGTSTLLISLFGKESFTLQNLTKKFSLPFKVLERNVFRATAVGLLASFLPGFGSSQAAIVASSTMRKKEPRDYLLLVGGINTVNFSFSLVTMAVLGKARNGAIVGVKQLLGSLSSASSGYASSSILSASTLLLFVPILLIVAGIAVVLGVYLSRFFAKWMQRVNYRTIVLSVIGALVFAVALLSGLQGILILIIATSLGIVVSLLGVQKNMLLGCLLLPVIFYLW